MATYSQERKVLSREKDPGELVKTHLSDDLLRILVVEIRELCRCGAILRFQLCDTTVPESLRKNKVASNYRKKQDVQRHLEYEEASQVLPPNIAARILSSICTPFYLPMAIVIVL